MRSPSSTLSGPIDTGLAGFSELLEMIADCVATPEATAVGVETDKNLLLVALQGAGFKVEQDQAMNRQAMTKEQRRILIQS